MPRDGADFPVEALDATVVEPHLDVGEDPITVLLDGPGQLTKGESLLRCQEYIVLDACDELVLDRPTLDGPSPSSKSQDERGTKPRR